MIPPDVRFGLRWLRANPGFTTTALVVLALGIGATTATYCVVHSVVLRPLPLPGPDRVIRIWSSNLPANVPFLSVSLPDLTDWRARSRTLSHLAGYDAQRAMVLKHGSGTEVVLGSQVTAALFPLLGVPAQRGRWLAPEEARPGGARVAVIAHGFWERRFGGGDALGKTIVLDDQPATIVGIMPSHFAVPNNPAEVWLPLQDAVDPGARANRYLRVLGRLRDGVQVEDVRAELARITGELSERYPESNRNWGVTIRPLEETVVSPELRRALLVLIGAVLFVLVVACANVAGLLLSRAPVRRREMAVRSALGATRGVLVRQMLVEGLMLASAGGAAGVLIAMWSIDALARIAANTLPRANEIAFRPAAAPAAIAPTAATALLFALVPALDVSRVTLASLRARDASGHGGRSRSRDLLVLAEVALAVVLLVGAGLLIRSFVRLQDRDLGFDPDRLLVVQLAAPDRPDAAERRPAMYEALLDRLQAAPGVTEAGAVVAAPFSGRNPGNRFTIAGRPSIPGEPPPNADYRVVTPGYLRTMRIPIVRGRDLRASDGAESPGVVISQSTARQYWPDTDPVGGRIVFGPHTLTIVGIAADARYAAIDAPTDVLRPMLYLPHRLLPSTPLEIVVRTRADPASVASTLRAVISQAAPGMPIARLRAMEESLAEARGPHRFYTTVLGAFAWLALLLAAAGLWGLVAYTVSRRRREIGIRVALGARPANILRMVAGRGIVLAAAGLAIGLAGAAAASRLLERLLIGVRPMDGVTFGTIAVVFLGVAALASILPARRGLRVDPAEALRLE
jgi:putative ABC transport system permease protein